MTIKKHTRKHLLVLRNQLPQRQFTLLSKQICDQILSHDSFKHSQTIAFYHALENEVDLSVLSNQNKSYYMPVIGKNNSMEFHRYHAQTKLSKNKFGILEPANSEIIDAPDIELCLVPLVGFNRQGVRLGMGGGYYDRYFESNKAHKKPTILAGVAYDFQEDATIQAEDWDVPLDIIFTNKEVIIP